MEVVACNEVLSWLLPGGTKGNHDKLFFRVTGLWVSIREWEYPVQNRSANHLALTISTRCSECGC